MQKLKDCIARSMAGDEPSQDDIGEAITEAVDVVESIADSLKRIAAATEARNARDPSFMAVDPNRV